MTLADVAGVILALNNAAAIADTATLTFGANSAVQMLATSGSETLASIIDSTSGVTLSTAGTYSASDLNAYFGVTSFTNTNGTTTGAETFTIVPVPEPATCFAGLLLCGASVVIVLRRRSAAPLA